MADPNWTLDDGGGLTTLKSEMYCHVNDSGTAEEIAARDLVLTTLGEMITAQIITFIDNPDVVNPEDPPLELKRAALKQTAYEFKQRTTPGLSSVQYADGSINKYQIDEWLKDVEKILNRHRRLCFYAAP